jgi:hypothetical protein
VVCWGDNSEGQCNVPADLEPVSAVSCGACFTAALTQDGVVRCWGQNNSWQCNDPAGLGKVVDLCCGWYHVAALTETGALVCWGRKDHGQCTVPPNLQVMMPHIELAPVSQPPPPAVSPQQQELNRLRGQLAAAQQHLQSSNESITRVSLECASPYLMYCH